jgi:hypothetical protein
LSVLAGSVLAGWLQAPATEVYLASFSTSGGRIIVGTPVNISRNAGYDNQPSFLPDSAALLFSSNRDGKQTDIYRHDIAAKQLSQVTKTPENEYSPLVTPDGKTFSTVRGDSQHLWRFDLDGGNPRVILERVIPVGYHVWIDATHVALFVLGAKGEPNTFQIADTTTGIGEVVGRSIGRSLLMRPGAGTVSFISTAPGEPRMIKTIHPRTRVVESLIAAPEGSQDAAWLADGRLLMARGRTLMAWTPGATSWTEAAAVTPGADGFDQMTRLAVSPDGRWLAFAAEPRQ